MHLAKIMSAPVGRFAKRLYLMGLLPLEGETAVLSPLTVPKLLISYNELISQTPRRILPSEHPGTDTHEPRTIGTRPIRRATPLSGLFNGHL